MRRINNKQKIALFLIMLGVFYIFGTSLKSVLADNVAWTQQTNSGVREWYSIASSADGTKLAAVNQGGYIYTSTDSGVNWTEQTNSGSRQWYGIASSSDGTKLAAVVSTGGIYTSTDSGVNWTVQGGAGSRSWQSIASSSDGTKLAAVDFNAVYTSDDSGVTWTPRIPGRSYASIASSADGTKLVAGVFGGYIYTSTDSGVTWTEREVGNGSLEWQSIASSADGTKLAAVDRTTGAGYIYTSDDSGVTWTQRTSAGLRYWFYIASSTDGTKLAAANLIGYIFTSTDSGVTWTQETGAGNRNWYSIASSADGLKLAAGTTGGYIYTGEPDITNPTISSLSPADEEADASVDNNLVITFDEAVDVETGSITIYKASDDSVFETISLPDAQVTGTGTTTITINPTSNLDSVTDYYVQIDATAFDDVFGNSFAGILNETTWNFATEDVENPTVSTFSPADNSTSVSLSTDLIITFSESVGIHDGFTPSWINIYRSSDSSLFEQFDDESVLVSGAGTNTITINPTTNFEENTDYYINIDSAFFKDTSLNGNFYAGIADTTTWNFSTSIPPSGGGGGGSPPNNAPIVSITFPNDNAIFGSGTVVPVSISAQDSDGSIDKVKLFVDGIEVSELNNSPYTYSLSGLSIGTHSLYAKAYDNKDKSTVSSSITITISNSVPIDPCITNPSLCVPPPPIDPCVTNPSLCVPPPIDPCTINPSLCTPPEEDPCITNPSLCIPPPPIDPCITNPSLCIPPEDPCEVDPSLCTPPPPPIDPIDPGCQGLTNSLICVVIDSYVDTRDIIGTTAVQVKEIIESPLGNVLTKSISTVGLIFGTAFTLLPILFLNPLSFSELALLPMRLWSLLLTVFGLKKRNRQWGTVYDSVTKRPLDPVYVILQDVEGKEIATSITDIDGRYGFLVEPGKYRILPTKTHYAFPSLKMVGKTRDEIYLDLYFGYVFEVKKEGEVITKNIPMDPEGFDWNEFTKTEQKLTRFYSKRDVVYTRIADIAFSIGFSIATLAILSAPKTYNIIIFSLYVVLLMVRELGIRQKKSGHIVRKGTDIPIAFAIIRVFDQKTNVEILHRVTNQIGKYFCLIQNGNYYVTIETKNPDETYTKVFTSNPIIVTKGIINEKFQV